MNYDIVYILKKDIDDTELKYSIRSVVKNFPYNKIWFIGGVPEHITPDEQIEFEQLGKNKWAKVTGSIKAICKNKDVTENFWLFNDDFFIMQPLDDLQPAIRGTMQRRVMNLNIQHKPSSYSKNLERAANELLTKGYDTLDYALHIPMLINKKKALETIKQFESPMFRCLYGNHHNIGGTIMDDVKIYDVEQEPTGDEVMLSTTNESFHHGKVGKHIKKKFNRKCKYEK